MNEFIHIRIMMGFVLSLGIAHILRGISKLIINPDQTKSNLLHLFWVFYLFTYIIFFWWWEYQLNKLTQWNFLMYILLISYALVIYFLCILIFPEDISKYKGFNDYYFARRAWFFGALIFMFIIDLIDTLLKGAYYFERMGINYPPRVGICVLLCLIAIKSTNKRYHAALALLLMCDNIFSILDYYVIN